MCRAVERGCGYHGASVGCNKELFVIDHHGSQPEHAAATPVTCYCDTDKCNGAVMTSSFGHVIMAVGVLINVIIGYLL